MYGRASASPRPNLSRFTACGAIGDAGRPGRSRTAAAGALTMRRADPERSPPTECRHPTWPVASAESEPLSRNGVELPHRRGRHRRVRLASRRDCQEEGSKPMGVGGPGLPLLGDHPHRDHRAAEQEADGHPRSGRPASGRAIGAGDARRRSGDHRQAGRHAAADGASPPQPPGPEINAKGANHSPIAVCSTASSIASPTLGASVGSKATHWPWTRRCRYPTALHHSRCVPSCVPRFVRSG